MNTDKTAVTDSLVASNTLTRRIAAQLGGKWRAYYREANSQRKERIGREITALNSKLAYEKARIAQRV